jgi:uncharacterized protein (DUF1015 family)
MAIISAFRSLRPSRELAPRVASPPYDVLSSAEARVVADKNPYSFLHITKAEIDLPEVRIFTATEVYPKQPITCSSFRIIKFLSG